MSDNPIKESWEKYYIFLEALRRTGVCNMYGASIYLEEVFQISNELSKKVLANWMSNYSQLSEKYNWKD